MNFGGLGSSFGSGFGTSNFGGINGFASLGGLGGIGNISGFGSMGFQNRGLMDNLGGDSKPMSNDQIDSKLNESHQFGAISSISSNSEIGKSQTISSNYQVQIPNMMKQLPVGQNQIIDIPAEFKDDQQSQQEKPKQERPIYQENNQVCKAQYKYLDQWISSQNDYVDENINKQASISVLVQRHLGNIKEQKRQQIIKCLSIGKSSLGLVNNEKYVLSKSQYHDQIKVLPADIGLRMYACKIGDNQFFVSASVLDISIQQLRQLTNPNQQDQSILSLIKSHLKAQGLQVKAERIRGVYLQSIAQFVTRAALIKAYYSIYLKKQIYNYFGCDLLIFRNYIIYCYSLKQKQQQLANKVSEAERRLRKLELNKLNTFLMLLKECIQLKKLLNDKKYEQVNQHMEKHKSSKLEHLLYPILKNHRLTANQQQKPPLFQQVLNNMKKKENSMVQQDVVVKFLIKAINSQRKQYIAVQNIENLNNNIDINIDEDGLQFVFNIINDCNMSRGFLSRFISVIKQKKANQSPFLALRRLILRYLNQIPILSENSLDQLFQYFSGIGDLPTTLKIQQKIMDVHRNKQDYVLCLLQFFIGRKLNTISPDSFMHNNYITKLKDANLKQLQGDLSILEEERSICLQIMEQIKQCVYQRDYKKLKSSDTFQKYKNFVELKRKKLSNSSQYDAIIILLDQIYNRDFLKFKKQENHPFIEQLMLKLSYSDGVVTLLGQKYDRNTIKSKKQANPFVEQIMFESDKKIKVIFQQPSWLVLPLLKSCYYHSLFLVQNKNYEKVKKVFRILPGSIKYFSVIQCALAEAVNFIQATQGILKSSYLKFLNQVESNFSVDLIILLQIMMKFPSTIYQHQKFRLQMSMRSFQRFYNNCKLIFNQSCSFENVCLVRATNQLMFSMCRDKFMDLDKMRQKLCELLTKKFQSLIVKYKSQQLLLQAEEQQGYLNIKLFECTMLLCQNKKNQVLVILKDLLTRYPQKFIIFYFFMKVKFYVTLEEKKATRDLIESNLQKILQKKDINLIKQLLTNQLYMGDVEQILYGDIKQKSIAFIDKLSRTMYEIQRQIPINLANNKIFQFFAHFLNKVETPQEQSHASFRRICIITLKQKQGINYDSDMLHTRQVKYNALRENPFLSYPVFEAIELKKVCLPDIKLNPKFVHVLNWGLSYYRACPTINLCWIKVYNWAKQILQKQNTTTTNQKQSKKIEKHIKQINKRILFLQQKPQSWCDDTIEYLDKKQNIEMIKFKQSMKQKTADQTKKISEKFILKVFKKLRNKVHNISKNYKEQPDKKPK